MEKWNRREFIKALGAGAVLLSVPSCVRNVLDPKPNFVFLLIDDMGWKDVGCYGSAFYETPNIDRLASQGMRFTDAYAASPVCSPTRASIFTGRHPARVNITDWIPGGDPQDRVLVGPQDRDELPLDEVTFAEILKEAGYATACIGKWHLGDIGFLPENQGFDINIGGSGAGQPGSYFYPYKYKGKWRGWGVPGLDGGQEGEYLTDRLTDESLAFIDQNKDQPSLLFFSHFAVHTPIQSKPELTEKYEEKIRQDPAPAGQKFKPEREAQVKQTQDNPAYAGMVQSTDESVGRIMQKLDELDLTDNTIVIFTSDNGGLSTVSQYSPTSNVPLRAGKGWLYEGGIREPLIIKWPGIIKAGTVCSAPVISTDFFPTLIEMARGSEDHSTTIDGVSLMPLLRQKGQLDRSALFWHFPHYHGSGNKPSGAVRQGDYKLIEWFEDGSVELYNVAEDISEEHDLASAMPEKVEELRTLLHEWRESVGAHMPTRNAAYSEE